MVTAGILPFRENSHGRDGNRTRDLMISSQILWPLDHEAGHLDVNKKEKSELMNKWELFSFVSLVLSKEGCLRLSVEN